MSATRYLGGVLAIAGVLLLSAVVAAKPGTYQSREDFLHETLGVESPASSVVWIDDELQDAATRILGHPVDRLRIRYWYNDELTAWVLDEIGKEKPITMGILVDHGRIESFRVLEFRESRGWEIRYPFFTRQFLGLGLDPRDRLDKRVDSISGATLSVRAATRTANLALLLDHYARSTNNKLH